MEQKEWEERLDRYADRTADAVRRGVSMLEDAFEKGKETIEEETAASADAGTPSATRGSRRLGLALVALGVLWLLHSLGILDQPVFPILVIILGVYFVARSK